MHVDAKHAVYRCAQEEHKRMEADGDISYSDSTWANPTGLKAHFQGTNDIRYR